MKKRVKLFIFLPLLIAWSVVLLSCRCKVICASKGTVTDERIHRGLIDWCTDKIGVLVNLTGHTQIYGNSDASYIARLTFHFPSKMSKQEIERHESRIAQQEMLIKQYQQEGRLHELDWAVNNFIEVIQAITKSDVSGVLARVRCFLIQAPLPMAHYYFTEFQSAVAYYATTYDGAVKIRLTTREEQELARVSLWFITHGFGECAVQKFSQDAFNKNLPGYLLNKDTNMYTSFLYRVIDTVIFNCIPFSIASRVQHPFNLLVAYWCEHHENISIERLRSLCSGCTLTHQQQQFLNELYVDCLFERYHS